jgi:chemotaxis family two-component system sensor kinase Cph1
VSRQEKISLNDLNGCAREPIHIPGRIQPHGILAAFDPASGRITRLSANADAETLENLMGPAMAKQALLALDHAAPKRLGSVGYKGTKYDCVVHRSGAEAILELERTEESDASFTKVYQNITSTLSLIGAAVSLEELWAEAARECKRISGYERVMIYQFDRDWNGTVIAEACENSIEPFLGLRYPASDIPAQARALYLRNWIRSIPDVSYDPVEIVSRAAKAAPLDLSFSQLRSVSPVHLEYLRNMGVAASMSVSIIHEGRLWGLIAFHHDSARFLSFELRQGLELIGKFLSLQIGAKERLENRGYRAELADRTRSLEIAMRSAGDPFEVLYQNEKIFLALVKGSTGGVLIRGGKVHRLGATPADIERLAAWLRASLGREPYAVTESLARTLTWAESAVASGMLALSIPESDPAYLVWFKPEVAQMVNWAGNPDKSAEQPVGQEHLSPRRSFALWKENLRNTALPFAPEEIAEALQLRRSVIERDLELQVQLVSQSNAELDQYASVISHDLKEPLRGIEGMANFLAEDLDGKLDEVSRENLSTIQRLAKWSRQLIAELYTYSRIGRTELNLEHLDLNELLRETQAMLRHQIDQRHARIEVQQPLPRVRADRLRTMEVFQNLLSNALKYNDRPNPRIEITSASVNGITEFQVVDDGIGIPAADRERVFNVFERLHGTNEYGGGSGMGLAIVKRVVERHGGKISVSEKLGGGSEFRFTLAPPKDSA